MARVRSTAIGQHQNVSLYATLLGEGVCVEYSCAPGRLAWVQVARGSLKLNKYVLSAGDGAALTDPGQLFLTGMAMESELLLFDRAGLGGGPTV